jgi:hypothetical protein
MTSPFLSIPGKGKAIKTCAYCSRQYKTFPSHKSIFCSLKCSNASRAKLKPQPCEYCGKDFIPENSRKHRFCSRICRDNYTKGINHPLWRGNRRHERGATWKANRKIARERDVLCVGCGASSEDAGQKLSVDHIIPFRFTAIYAQTDNLDPNDLLNLVTLCRACHAKKTQAERILLRGDLEGFLSIVRDIIPAEHLDAAIRLWHIGELKPNLLTFEPVASFLDRTGFGVQKKGFDIRTCEVCGSSFTRIRGQYSKKHTCSQKCAYILRKKTRGTKGFRKCGPNHPSRKLTQEIVDGVRAGRANGETNKTISQRFGISNSHVQRVAMGQIWSEVGMHEKGLKPE